MKRWRRHFKLARTEIHTPIQPARPEQRHPRRKEIAVKEATTDALTSRPAERVRELLKCRTVRLTKHVDDE
jgi:hypothetical protein